MSNTTAQSPATEPAQAAAPAADAAPPPIEAAAGDESIESLDSELAGLADELLEAEGGSLDPADDVFGLPVPATADPAEEADAGSLPQQDAEPSDPPEPAAPDPEPVAEAEAPPAGLIPDPAAETPPEAKPTVMEIAAGHVHAMLSMMSSPVKRWPDSWRDAVGWLAIFHIALAVLIWAYVLLFRQS